MFFRLQQGVRFGTTSFTAAEVVGLRHRQENIEMGKGIFGTLHVRVGEAG